MKYLWLLRHAKATPSAPGGGGDALRPLSPSGRRDATALGRRLAAGEGVFGLDESVPIPRQVVCSSAVRTRQTAEALCLAMGRSEATESYRSLYGADPGTALGIVREFDSEADSVMLLGHNPTMYELAWDLISTEVPSLDGRELLRTRGFPPCALAVLCLEIETWQSARDTCGSLAGLFAPPY